MQLKIFHVETCDNIEYLFAFLVEDDQLFEICRCSFTRASAPLSRSGLNCRMTNTVDSET